MSDRIIRIGGASGALSDSALSVPQLLSVEGLNYLAFDYLGEAAMGMMAKMRAADPDSGFMREFIDVQIGPYLAEIARKGVRITANAGAMNPRGLAKQLRAVIADLGLSLTVAALDGDDLTGQAADFRARGVRDMFTGQAFPDQVVSINAYLGAFPIAQALAEGADIVITGRVVDSALILGPLIHEFGWGEQDFDLLAAGTAAGHLLECGAQATGGTFTDWRDVPDWANIGFPVAECHADGSFVMTKPDGTGGLVSIGTISEQLLYEVSDPQAYLVPDVSCDFAFARLEEVGPDRIRVTGIRGYPPTADYKVCVTFDDGWRATAIQPIIGIEAPAKARRQADAILERMTRMLSAAGLPPLRRSHVEIIGTEAGYGPNARPLAPREVICRIVIDADDRRAADIFWREQNSAIMNMAVGTTIGLGTALPRCWPILGLFSFLIPKDAVQACLSFEDREIPCGPALIGDFSPAQIERAEVGEVSASASAEHSLPLLALAWVRSGEKGDLFNVAVVARRPEYLPFIRAALTTEAVGARYRHLLGAPDHPRVTCYEVPGLHALNFVIEDAQAGGINSSPRLDPAAKSMGQHLLEQQVEVPEALVDAVDSARADAIL